ncbi:MAG: cytochrome c biogenesis protein CcsA [Candidatus Latescibacterota bacterium]|nr:cytochrome c biogenesis protein CcsA [Candidatus Latescibacterota bacterium]
MTTLCIAFLSFSLVCYLVASLLFQGQLLWDRNRWGLWARRLLIAGVAVNVAGLLLHALFSGQSPLSHMVLVISLVVIAFLVSGLLLDALTSVRNLNFALAPIAFLALLYPLLMPVRFESAESILVQYPWLGVHVLITLLGHVGFAIAFFGALAYLLQARNLKHGRLGSFLPALDTIGNLTFHTAGAGFFFFTIGLGMGVLWLFSAPGEQLGADDLKILLALPTWLLFAGYLVQRGLRGRQGTRMKWLVITGFVVALVNYLAVRHDFETASQVGLRSLIGIVG